MAYLFVLFPPVVISLTADYLDPLTDPVPVCVRVGVCVWAHNKELQRCLTGIKLNASHVPQKRC